MRAEITQRDRDTTFPIWGAVLVPSNKYDCKYLEYEDRSTE